LKGTVNLKKILAFILTAFLLSTSAFAVMDTYVLLERDGIVAVFKGTNTDTPEFLTDIVVLSLPAADREMLKTGIRIEGEPELYSILEDLGS